MIHPFYASYMSNARVAEEFIPERVRTVVQPSPGDNTPNILAVTLVDPDGNLLTADADGSGGAALHAVAVVPAASTLTTAMTGSNQVVSAAPLDYRGFSVRETTGTAAATVVIYDHASAASGTILDAITLTAGESAREYYGEGGIKAANGVYVSVVSGAVAGSVRHS